jgi:hypothetical protein
LRHRELKTGAEGREMAHRDAKPRRVIHAAEEAGWLSQIEAGETLAAIASRSGVQIRTVREHVKRARAASELAQARREGLRTALAAHEQGMLNSAAWFRGQLSANPLYRALEATEPDPQSAAGKLHRALLAHTRDSGLPYLARRWSAVAKSYRDGIAGVERQLPDAVARVRLDQRAVSELLYVVRLGASAGEIQPDDDIQPWNVREGSELCRGMYCIASGIRALDDPQAIAAQATYAQLRTDLAGWVEVRALCALPATAGRVREKLIDELDNIALRRYLLDGTCEWCPGVPARRRRATSNQGAPGD